MKERLQALAKRVDALSLRERAMMFGAAAFALVMLFNLAVWEPQAEARKKAAARIQADQQKEVQVQAEIQKIARELAVDPDAALKVRLKELQERAQETRNELARLQQSLVAPERMTELVESLLRRQAGLRLVRMESLPTEQLNQGQERGTQPGAATGVIYKHGLELVIQGSYAEITAYLDALEKLPWQLFWGRAVLSTEARPRVTLTLTLYTLSREEKWLNL